ncbi:MAG: SEC-C domain-containing protein [Clostridia bacterium]|nr:SEC-C domain-containing protein [Clostridia bacterium]
MSLLKEWESIVQQNAQTPEGYKEFWNGYIEVEKQIYIKILEAKETHLKGSIKELAEAYDVIPVIFIGFLDGVNTSLTEEMDLENLTEDSAIDVTIDLKKLYFNMLDAKAEWLYKLPEWDAILTEEEKKEIKKEFMLSKTVIKEPKIGRNDPCPCGSGKKYKKCCLNK